MAICNVTGEDTDGNSVDPKDYFGEEDNNDGADGAAAEAQENTEEKCKIFHARRCIMPAGSSSCSSVGGLVS